LMQNNFLIDIIKLLNLTRNKIQSMNIF
jgi:hypothetical protein